MNASRTMQAIAIDRYGGKELLQPRELPVPTIGPDEVLVRVEAAGVGVWDAMVRAGVMDAVAPATFPLILGADCAGTVAEAGANVRAFRPGDKVYTYSFLNPKGGSYAQYVAVPSTQVARTPAGLPVEQAGALAVPGLTALHGLTTALKLQAGERLLVFGAGSVGQFAVQLAKRMDVRVLAVAAGAESVALAQALGADETVDGKGGDVIAAIRRFAPDGLDAVLATTGAPGLDLAIAAIRPGGRLAYPNGVQPEPKAGPGIETAGYNGTPDRQTFDQLNTLIEAGPFKVQVDQTFPLGQAMQAQGAMEGRHLGRMVLLVA